MSCVWHSLDPGDSYHALLTGSVTPLCHSVLLSSWFTLIPKECPGVYSPSLAIPAERILLFPSRSNKVSVSVIWSHIYSWPNSWLRSRVQLFAMPKHASLSRVGSGTSPKHTETRDGWFLQEMSRGGYQKNIHAEEPEDNKWMSHYISYEVLSPLNYEPSHLRDFVTES